MPIQTECGVQSVEQLNPYAYSMVLNAGSMAHQALPGQFVHIKCGQERLLRRPISICDADGDRLRLVFEVRGEGTEWLARRQEGDRVDVLGPQGNGFDLAGDKLLLVGGGIGLPPMLYAAKACRGEAHVVAGFRSQDRAMLLDDFARAAKTVAVTSDDGSIGTHGFVDAAIKNILDKDSHFTSILACGPKAMLKSVVRAAEPYGIPVQVSMEERMACGVGACLGCAVQMADGSMKHVCKDGPVFLSTEVDWNV